MYTHVCPLCGAELASAPEPGLLPSFSVCRCDLLPDGAPRFILEQSHDNPGGLVLTDRKLLIVIRFKEKEFNDTQRVSFISDDMERHPDIKEITQALRIMGDWLALRHRSAATSEPHGVELDDDGYTVIYRNKFPRWRLTVQDTAATLAQVGTSVRKASEFLRSCVARQRQQRQWGIPQSRRLCGACAVCGSG